MPCSVAPCAPTTLSGAGHRETRTAMNRHKEPRRRCSPAFLTVIVTALLSAIPAAAGSALTVREPAIAARRYGVAAAWRHFVPKLAPAELDPRPLEIPHPVSDPTPSSLSGAHAGHPEAVPAPYPARPNSPDAPGTTPPPQPAAPGLTRVLRRTA